MIALMLSYLFYFKGMQQVKADSRRKRNSILTGKVASLNITKSKGGILLGSAE
jgi:hypothetical protein